MFKDSKKTFYFEKLPKTAKYSAKINTVVETVTFRQLTKAVAKKLVSMHAKVRFFIRMPKRLP